MCQNDGSACANSGLQLYESYGDKIWAQASIDLLFLPFTTLNSTALWDFQSATDLPGPAVGSILRLYFVPDIDNNAGFYGLAWLGANGMGISDTIFSANRYDTIAHEIGHNLGLQHYDQVNGTAGCDSGESAFLLSSGNCRSVPNGLGNVYPDGSDLDRLSASEISTAIATGLENGWLTVPEPSTVLLSAAGFLAIALRVRRRRC